MVQAIENLFFVKKNGAGGIDVFGGSIAQVASAKGDDVTVCVMDGENNAVAIAMIRSGIVTSGGDSRFGNDVIAKSLAFEMSQ